MKPRQKKILLLVLFSLVLSFPCWAAPCWKTIFDWNEGISVKKKGLLLLPFKNETGVQGDEWLPYLFPVVLKDYFLYAKKIVPRPSLFIPAEEDLFDPVQSVKYAEKEGVDYLLMGKFQRQGPLLQIHTRIFNVKENREIGRISGEVEFPGTRKMNDFLLNLVEQSSKPLKEGGLKQKKLFPYRNDTASAEALHYFTLGEMALIQGSALDVEEALQYFQEAIRNDYNYVPAYLGLSLAWARKGLVQQVEGIPHKDSFTRSRLELEKARLLNPHLTKGKERQIEAYLNAENHSRLAKGYASQGNLKKGIAEMEKGLRLLPGNLLARQRLVQFFEQSGQKKRAEEEQKIVDQLNRCGESS